MLIGRVTARRQPVVPSKLRGANGVEIDALALVDSGFTGALAIPAPIAEQLGLNQRWQSHGFLADESRLNYELCPIGVSWMGAWRMTVASIIGNSVIVGMRLLDRCELKIACVSGGVV